MSARHVPCLDGLAAVVAEAEMHGAAAFEGSEDAVDGLGGDRRVFGIARDVGFVHLETIAGQPGRPARPGYRQSP